MAARSDASRLLELVGANWTTQAIGAAVSLGVVDQLAESPLCIDDLSRRTQCDGAALLRLLRALSSIGITRVDPDCRHALTPLGALLLENAAGSVRWWALWCSGPQWMLWGDLAASVRSGRSARSNAGGRPGYAHLDSDPDSAAIFHRAMAGLTRRIGREVARIIDWQGVRQVVDIGGGYGELLAEVLARQPALTGIVFDLPHAARDADEQLAQRGLAARCTVVAGSFFDAMPSAADVYLLKSILHNWDDADALRILRQCRAAMPDGARVLIVERVLPERLQGGRRERAILRSDLNMLVSLGGRERTRREFADLAKQAGFGVPRLAGTVLDYSVLEVRAALRPRGAAAMSAAGRPGRDTRARSRDRPPARQ